MYPDLLLITDTGCNAPREDNLKISSLRRYLEEFPVEDDKPLNEGGQKDYVILCSHSHYDHILGIPEFLKNDLKVNEQRGQVSFIASGYDRSFIEKDLDKHSLCRYIKVPTPQYTVSHWAEHLSYLTYPFSPPVNTTPFALRVQTIQIPGHTPDSLAWYDIDEAHLYVGDTFYTRQRSFNVPGLPSLPGGPSNAAIIFPREGNLFDFMKSLDCLLDFVQFQNQSLERVWREEGGVGKPRRVKVGCGHVTMADDAEAMIEEVTSFFDDIIKGKVPVKQSSEKRGVVFDFWEHVNEAGRFDVLAPRKLVDDVRDWANSHVFAKRYF